MSPMLAHAVDAALARLARVYGAEFAAKYGTQTPETIRATWALELGAFTHRLDAIAWASNHLPERCPNPIQFRKLCYDAPAPQQIAMLPSTEPTRAPTQAELDRLHALGDEIRRGEFFARPSRRWAHRLLERADAGEQVHPLSLRLAAEALGRHESVPHETPDADDELSFPPLQEDFPC